MRIFQIDPSPTSVHHPVALHFSDHLSVRFFYLRVFPKVPENLKAASFFSNNRIVTALDENMSKKAPKKAPKGSKKGEDISKLIKRVGNEDISGEDIQAQLQSRKFERNDRVIVLQPLKDNVDAIIQDLRGRLNLKEGEEDQRVKELETAIRGLRSLGSSAFTARMLGDRVYEIAVICKSIMDSNVKFSRDSVAQKYLNPFLEMHQKARGYALDAKRDYLSSCFPNAKEVDNNRLFGVDGTVPDDEGLRLCIFCAHEMVDCPNTNSANHTANAATRRKYEQEKAEYEADKDAWKSKHGKSKPAEPKYKPVYLQCHCAQMACSGFRQGTCEECKRNPPNVDGNGKCPCQICQCVCSASVLVSDASIQLQSTLSYACFLTETTCCSCTKYQKYSRSS